MTRQHRAFHCQAFADTYMKHSDIATELSEDDPLFAELPVPFLHPHYEYHDALLQNMPIPVVPETTKRVLSELEVPILTFFTDGSCKYPTSPSTCFSAFSIVADLAGSDVERKRLADTCLSTGTMPSTLLTILVGRTKGRQHIHRAELSAIVLLFENFDDFHVFMDSATAISMVNLCRRVSDLRELSEHDDFDLLSRLFASMGPNKKVLKIKAHQDVSCIADPLPRYFSMGNAVADIAANKACTQLLPEVVQQLEGYHHDAQEQGEKVIRYWNLNLDLQAARARAGAVRSDTEICVATPNMNVRDLLINWTITYVWTQPSEVNDVELWGFQWAAALMEWIRSSKWPSASVEDDPGISWTEIAVLQGQWLPVKRKRGQCHYLVQPTLPQDLQDLGITLSEQATNVYNLMCQVQGLTDRPILPPHCRFGKCKSFYLQGHAAWTTGLSVRPQFAMQPKVFQILHDFLALHSGMTTLPDVDISPVLYMKCGQKT